MLCLRFLCNVIKHIFNSIIKSIKDIIGNFEAVSITLLAAVGATALLKQLPFYITLPLWIESTMVYPMIASFIVLLLCISLWRRSCGDSVRV